MDEETPQRWYLLSEESFCSFCTCENLSEKWNILRSVSQISSKYCTSQQKVIDELVYRALTYSFQQEFDFQSADTLVNLLENELIFLEGNDSLGPAEPTSLLRFQAKIQKLKAVPTGDCIRKMLHFLTDNLFRCSSAYLYILQAFPEEDDLVIELDIDTPLILPLLSAGTQLFTQD